MQHILATVMSTVVSLTSLIGTESVSTAPPVAMKPVEIIRIDKPVYPDFARFYGMEGEVVVEVQVGEDGKARHVHLVKGDHPVFNSAVISAVTNAEYSPAKMQGNPVKSWIKIPFTFRHKK